MAERACKILLLLAAVVSPAPLPAQWMQLGTWPGGTVSAVTSAGRSVYAGSYDGGLWRYSEEAAPPAWVPVTAEGLNRRRISALSGVGATIYVGVESTSGNAVVYRSTDGDSAWLPRVAKTGHAGSWITSIQPVRNPLTGGQDLYMALAAYVDLFSEAHLAQLHVSSDGGDTWRLLWEGNNGSWPYDFVSSGDVLVLSLGNLPSQPAIVRSTDFGTSWVPPRTSLPPNMTSMLESEGILFGSTDNGSWGICRSTNSGNDWEVLRRGPAGNVSTLAAYQGRIFAGTTGDGVVWTSNGGSTWGLLNEGLASLWIEALVVVSDLAPAGGPALVAATDAGVWYYPLRSTTAASEVPSGVPASTVLEQNFPNPFNPSTMIRFDLPESGFAELGLYDLLGREVGIILRGDMEAGGHRVAVDGSGLASGAYFYTLRFAGRTHTRRLVLVR